MLEALHKLKLFYNNLEDYCNAKKLFGSNLFQSKNFIILDIFDRFNTPRDILFTMSERERKIWTYNTQFIFKKCLWWWSFSLKLIRPE